MEATASQPGAAPEEVLFLVVQALCQGPFAKLGEAVAREAAEQGLLPRRHDLHGAPPPLLTPAASATPLSRGWPSAKPVAAPHCCHAALAVAFCIEANNNANLSGCSVPPCYRPCPTCSTPPAGGQHALGFPELQQRYAHLPPNALQQLLSQLLERRRQEAPQPAARGLTSLLEGGTLSVLSGAAAAAAPGPPPPPAWLRPAQLLASQPYRLLLLRQCGLLRSAQHPVTVQPGVEYGRQLQHHLTVRGHRFAVYCVTYDRSGRYLITGSDDRLVKVSSVGLNWWLGGW
jgi:hypothetical protein